MIFSKPSNIASRVGLRFSSTWTGAVGALILAASIGCSSNAPGDGIPVSTGSGGSNANRQGGSGGAASGGAGGSSSGGNAGTGGANSGSGGAGGADTSGQGGQGGSTAVDAPAADGNSGGAAGTGGAGPAAGGTPLETFEVPASGDAAASKLSLEKDQIFLLRASGAIDFAGTKVDAEFASTDGTTGMDSAGGADVGLDNGLKELILLGAGAAPPKPGPNRMKWFGGFKADHVYYMWLTGAGAPASLKLVKPAGAAAGTGSISVAIYQLTPMPTGLDKPLESVPVSYLTKVAREMSMFKPAGGKVYLLRANGESQVGGPGANGDADFDDYGPTSTNANQGEGGADFGVCVDEGCVAARKLKWGPYRKDHDYYMLYAGTGMPITFAYCDTGYGDNKGPGTNALPVDIYEVP
jgi:hypothetical protein